MIQKTRMVKETAVIILLIITKIGNFQITENKDVPVYSVLLHGPYVQRIHICVNFSQTATSSCLCWFFKKLNRETLFFWPIKLSGAAELQFKHDVKNGLEIVCSSAWVWTRGHIYHRVTSPAQDDLKWCFTLRWVKPMHNTSRAECSRFLSEISEQSILYYALDTHCDTRVKKGLSVLALNLQESSDVATASFSAVIFKSQPFSLIWLVKIILVGAYILILSMSL